MYSLSMHRVGSFAIAIGLALITGRASAQFSWSNPAGGNWSANTNWTGGTAPAAGGSAVTTLSFGLSSSYIATDDLAGAFSLSSLTFSNPTSTTVTLAPSGGNALNFTGALPTISLTAPGNASVTLPVTLDNNLTVNLGSTAGNLSFGNTVNGNSTTNNLIVSATGSTTGSVTLAGGGTFNQLSIQAGSASATGGILSLTFPTGANNVNAGLQLGAVSGQTASFTASNAATVNVTENVYVGDAAGSTGTVTVTGAGTTLNAINGASNRFAVGNFGSGTLNITNGGIANVGLLFQNRQAGSGTSTILVDGPGSTLHAVTQATFGSFGVGNTTVQNGGTITADSLFIVAANAGGAGTVTITGTGSSATVGALAEIAPANGGAGMLIVQNGAAFSATSSSGALLLGSFSTGATGGTGTVTVTGTGSKITLSGALQVATNTGSSGTLNVQNGGAMSVVGSTRIGLNSGSTGTLNVLSGGSYVQTGAINVGVVGASGVTPAASGTITVSGASSTLAAASNVTLGGGATPSGNALMTVSDAGAVTVGGQLSVGLNAGSTATLNVLSGGSYSVTGLIEIGVAGASGATAAANGTINVSSANSMFTASSGLLIGGDASANAGGVGLFTVANGGTATIADQSAIGTNSGSSGTLTIQSGGKLVQNASMFVGLFGQNGLIPAAVGTINVSGAGSSLTLPGTTSDLIFGGGAGSPSGTGNLNLSAGGSITAPNVLFAQDVGTTATGIVDSATLSAGTALVVAINGAATLTIQNGGAASAPGAVFIGVATGSTGTIIVTGAGSTLTSTGGAVLGGDGAVTPGGTAILTVTSGGNVSLPGGLQLYAGGTANINAGGFMTVGGLFDGITGSSVGTVNIAAGATLTINDDGGSFSGVIAGAGSITKTVSGTQTLSGTNTYTGGTIITGGTIAVTSDAALGGGPVNVGGLGTLLYTTSTTSTGRAFPLTNGTITVAAGQTLTLAGTQMTGGYLAGPGTFATTPGSRASFGNMTTRPSATLNSNSNLDQFVNFTNGGNLNLAAGQTAPFTFVAMNNAGSGTITIGAGSSLNVSDFQSYGLLMLPDASAAPNTLMTNVGSSPLHFNSGSRTFIGAIGGNGLAQLELNGQNAIVTGGLFVNNGHVTDNSILGVSTIIADYGALVKGAGQYDNSPITQNGGKFQAGNSPGVATVGRFVFGPGGVSNYVFAIDDATGQAGPTPDAAGHVSGWGLVRSAQWQRAAGATSGDFLWTANAANPLTIAIDTLVNPTTVGTDVPGLMADFDPTRSYSWPAVEWTGTYSGPTDVASLDAATNFDTSGFANPIAGTFSWTLGDSSLSLSYTPSAVPEPGTLALVGAAAAAGLYRRRRMSR